jgi:hypothetical protein
VIFRSFGQFAVDEHRAGAHQPTRWCALTARHRSCAAVISLYAMASPAAFDPGPRVILVRCLTVAKVDSIGFVVRRCTQGLRRTQALGFPLDDPPNL